jgi:DEAD/DEAH box helicase
VLTCFPKDVVGSSLLRVVCVLRTQYDKKKQIFFQKMAKKKGKKGKQDARGYSTTAIVTKTIEIPAATNITDSECSDTCFDADNVTVSSTQFARTDINDRECSDQFLDIEKLTVSSIPSANISATNNKTSRAFFKRIENLSDRLLECKFKEDQIRNAISGLVLESNLPSMSNTKSNTSPFNLDDALDWLCSNIPPDDLPPLFRDDSSHNPKPKDASAIEAFLSKPTEKSVPPDRTLMSQSANQLSIHKVNSLKNVEKNATVHENKEWILKKFQFEVDEGGNSNCVQTVTTCPVGPSTSEMRILELERSIDALKADVNDDAANYMRSKFEVKDLRNQLSTLTKQYQKLKASIAKSKTKLDKRLHNSEEDETDYLHLPESESESEIKDSSDLGVGGICTVLDQDITSAVDFVSRISQDHSHEIASNVDLEILKNAIPLIPKGWTGTTPAKELEIWCRRQGFPHPVFSKKLDSNFNLQIKSNPNELKIQIDASFESRDHAQQYLSLVALYRISPDRSLQHVLPPVFADLWKSWHRKKEEVRLIDKAEERNAKDEVIQGLIALIPKQLQVGGGIEAMEIYPQNLDLHHHAPSVVKNVAGSLETQMKTRNNECSQALMLEFETRKSCTAYKTMESSRRQLPIFAYKEEFLDVYFKNRVTVLCAETGAGKTTQIPQFILEQSLTNGRGNEIGIICTQPRRISAISVAERVAEEMCVNIGDIVGYQIKGEASKSRRTKLLYCTTGIILRRLQDDPELSGVTTVILDEVHERSWQIDFLLVALRKLVFSSRSDLKIVLVSQDVSFISIEKVSKINLFSCTTCCRCQRHSMQIYSLHFLTLPLLSKFQVAVFQWKFTILKIFWMQLIMR